MVITIMSQLSIFLLVSVAEQTIYELIPVFSRDVVDLYFVVQLFLLSNSTLNFIVLLVFIQNELLLNFKKEYM